MGHDLRVAALAGQLMSKHVTEVEFRDALFEAGLSVVRAACHH